MNDAATRVAFTASDVDASGRSLRSRSGGIRCDPPADRISTPPTKREHASCGRNRSIVHDEAGFARPRVVYCPANVPRGIRAPTLLEIHGGPEVEFGNTFFQEMQMLAGRGYNVVFANPRGSVGYGYRYTAALAKNWGDPMFRDEMAVMDAVAKRPDVDTASTRRDERKLRRLRGGYG